MPSLDRYILLRINRRDPQVLAISRLTGLSVEVALALAIDWFWWVDEHCCGPETGLDLRGVDEVVGAPDPKDNGYISFAAALMDARVGWLDSDGDGRVLVVGFDRNFGKGTKRRVREARRKAEARKQARLAALADKCPQGNGQMSVQERTNVRDEADKCPQGSGQNADLQQQQQQQRSVLSERELVADGGADVFDPPAVRLLMQTEGMDRAAAVGLAAFADADAVVTALANARYLRAGGKLPGGDLVGYVAEAVSRRDRLKPRAAKHHRELLEVLRRIRESDLRRRRTAEWQESQAESERFSRYLESLDPSELVALANDAWSAAPPITRQVIGCCRDPTGSPHLRAQMFALVWDRLGEIPDVAEKGS